MNKILLITFLIRKAMSQPIRCREGKGCGGGPNDILEIKVPPPPQKYCIPNYFPASPSASIYGSDNSNHMLHVFYHISNH